MTIDLSERQIERTARGSRAVNPPPLLVDTNGAEPLMKAVIPLTEERTYSVESLLKGYYRHFATGACPWADDPLRPSIVELINCMTSCDGLNYNKAIIYANAILGRLARGQ